MISSIAVDLNKANISMLPEKLNKAALLTPKPISYTIV